MIAENELRIGSWYLDSSGNPKQVKSIYDGYVNPDISMHTLEIYGDTLEDIDPIPLTPEILQKCNLDSDVYSLQYLNAGTNYYFKMHEKRLRLIEYLHELQDIYHAIDGEELDVKL